MITRTRPSRPTTLPSSRRSSPYGSGTKLGALHGAMWRSGGGSRDPIGEQGKGLDVGSEYDGEVAAVEGGDAVHAEALGDGNERGVGATAAEVGVTLGEVDHAADVGERQFGELHAPVPKFLRNCTSGGAPLREGCRPAVVRGSRPPWGAPAVRRGGFRLRAPAFRFAGYGVSSG